jgi:hypothetical protein
MGKGETVKAQYLWWVAGAVVAYIVYETWIHPAAASNGIQLPTAGSPATSQFNPDANQDMGGADFGVLDPSNWN